MVHVYVPATRMVCLVFVLVVIVEGEGCDNAHSEVAINDSDIDDIFE